MKKSDKEEHALEYQLLLDEIEDYLGEKVLNILAKRVEDKINFINKLNQYLDVK